MSDDVEPQRRRFWPQSVRVRLTVVATLAFAITISAAAFGLVRLVRTNLVDRIEETNQQQLDTLQAKFENGDLQPPPDHHVYCCIPGPDGQLHYYTQRQTQAGVEAAQREVRTTAGNITLVAQQSTDELDRTVALGEHGAAVRGARA